MAMARQTAKGNEVGGVFRGWMENKTSARRMRSNQSRTAPKIRI